VRGALMLRLIRRAGLGEDVADLKILRSSWE